MVPLPLDVDVSTQPELVMPESFVIKPLDPMVELRLIEFDPTSPPAFAVCTLPTVCGKFVAVVNVWTLGVVVTVLHSDDPPW